MTPPLATTADLPSSSTARRYISPESNIPHPNLPETTNFNTRQVPVPFDDAAFTNAAMLEYTDSLSESIEIAVGQTFKDKSWCQHKSLRRVLAIDGTHLKGKYKGVLFIATALDGDNHIFPVAFDIGESENGSSWNWFLTYLGDAIGSPEDLVIISDRHKGLLKEVPHVFPRAIHGYYAYHIYRNLVDTFKDKSLEMYYWRAVKTCRVAEFEKLMHDIEMANPIYVNALFKEAREYPVTKLIEGVRLKIQELFYKRRESAASFIGPLTPWAEQQLKDLVQKARDVRCHPISRDEYYAVGDYNDTVNLSKFSCTCREFSVKGYPCMHVLSACINYNLPHYSYCSPFYTVQNYKATYSESVYPVRDKSEWEEISVGFKEYCAQIKPPGQRRSAGRPKKLRIPSRGEESKTTKCGRCKQTGHNRRRCKFPISEK
ncbi:uncharacterized protein LOC131218217 [Magnolia sinica]|uniref:uncharacterized protein LOC131218217 n=1 Tax=Magnolia sinica TaxID=86752 RepID=UPI0026585F27|nr:uncharacterized protein LOC131218217 [Magnolia sinica]